MLRILQQCFHSLDYYTLSFNSRHRHLHSSVSLLRLYAYLGNAGTEIIYSIYRTDAAAEASYDRARSTSIVCLTWYLRNATTIRNNCQYCSFSVGDWVSMKSCVGIDNECFCRTMLCERGQGRGNRGGSSRDSCPPTFMQGAVPLLAFTIV